MALAFSSPAGAASRRYRLLFGGIVIVAGLAQLVLFLYVAAPGLGGTSDSRLYLHAAQTLRETGQLLNPDGTPYRYWPPLYPALLAAVGSPVGIRMLHGACLLGSLGLWSWLGRQLLPARRALVLPVLLALSTPWLLVSKFIWSESLFVLLFAAYAACLFQWLRSGRRRWWLAATAAGFLMPLERTLGLFLLAGIGGRLVLAGWRKRLSYRRWLPLGLHLAMSIVGGVWWQWHALHAGPSRYHPSRGWNQLLSSGADYGFVLGRWLLLLPASGRTLLPAAAWAALLLALFWCLWPRRNSFSQGQITALTDGPVAITAPECSLERFSGWSMGSFWRGPHPLSLSIGEGCQPPASLNAPLSIGEGTGVRPNPYRNLRTALAPSNSHVLMLQALWSACATLVALVAFLTLFAQSAAGIHDAERYASVLFGPFMLLLLAAWPARLPRWVGLVAAGALVLFAMVRVGHVAQDLRRVPPVSFPVPAPHGQRVGAAGE